MTLGAVAASRRRSLIGNLIANGTFDGDSDAGWSNLWFSGKSVTGGKLVFAATPAYDGAIYGCGLAAGSYYELAYTISARSTGDIAPAFTGGTQRDGVTRTANGTYTERMLANTGNTQLEIWSRDVAGTFSVDNITLLGPYTTSTVGGA